VHLYWLYNTIIPIYHKLTITVSLLWWAVEYDGTLFPGEIRSLQGDDYEVSVIVKAGRYWKWSHLEDTIFFQKQNVQKKLNASKVVSSRVNQSINQ